MPAVGGGGPAGKCPTVGGGGPPGASKGGSGLGGGPPGSRRLSNRLSSALECGRDEDVRPAWCGGVRDLDGPLLPCLASRPRRRAKAVLVEEEVGSSVADALFERVAGSWRVVWVARGASEESSEPEGLMSVAASVGRPPPPPPCHSRIFLCEGWIQGLQGPLRAAVAQCQASGAA